MRAVLVVLTVVAAAMAAPGVFMPIMRDYHEEIGIAKATRIKASEEALDFDGSRVTGGSYAYVGQFPFMAGLVISLTSGFTSACGASLISNSRLVTAAHCWRHGSSIAQLYTVVLGSVQLFSGGVRIDTNEVLMHPQYNQRNINNDIAIIRISHVSFTANINRISLPVGNNDYAGEAANIIGFGQVGDDRPITRYQVLSHARINVISQRDCLRYFGPHVVIHSTLCTSGAGGRGPCPGDSGGPLQIEGPTLIGVASFNPFDGCENGGPSGFARVTAFVPWILTNM